MSNIVEEAFKISLSPLKVKWTEKNIVWLNSDDPFDAADAMRRSSMKKNAQLKWGGGNKDWMGYEDSREAHKNCGKRRFNLYKFEVI